MIILVCSPYVKSINNYKKLGLTIEEIIKTQTSPISAYTIRDILHRDHKIGRVDTNPRSIAQRVRGNPKIGKVHIGDRNYYFFIDEK